VGVGHLPLLQSLQQMLPHLVLIERAVSRLFSINYASAVAKAILQRAAVGSRGGPGIAAKFGPGGPIILLWTVRGTTFEGGLSTA